VSVYELFECPSYIVASMAVNIAVQVTGSFWRVSQPSRVSATNFSRTFCAF